MKSFKTGSRPNDGFAVCSGFCGGSAVQSPAIQSNCLGAQRPLTQVPASAEVI
ncbi:hypothetical protein D9M71_714980 [compost metagenome]|uniref:hypothetical protein n=1 Tax=Metapseudomonas resinovorans TaxID=53412 RepID=UPI0012DE590A|nr:hypothetical protein [Pseudomonas resinovorans]